MGGELKNRVRFTTSISKQNAETLKMLSEASRIQQSKLVDEALNDLFEKHKDTIFEHISQETLVDIENMSKSGDIYIGGLVDGKIR